jgi:hypothetical protein
MYGSWKGLTLPQECFFARVVRCKARQREQKQHLPSPSKDTLHCYNHIAETPLRICDFNMPYCLRCSSAGNQRENRSCSFVVCRSRGVHRGLLVIVDIEGGRSLLDNLRRCRFCKTSRYLEKYKISLHELDWTCFPWLSALLSTILREIPLSVGPRHEYIIAGRQFGF